MSTNLHCPRCGFNFGSQENLLRVRGVDSIDCPGCHATLNLGMIAAGVTSEEAPAFLPPDEPVTETPDRGEDSDQESSDSGTGAALLGLGLGLAEEALSSQSSDSSTDASVGVPDGPDVPEAGGDFGGGGASGDF